MASPSRVGSYVPRKIGDTMALVDEMLGTLEIITIAGQQYLMVKCATAVVEALLSR